MRRGSPAPSKGKGELVVRRVGPENERRETRSRAFVNGRLCTAAQLAELATDLWMSRPSTSASADRPGDPPGVPGRLRQASAARRLALDEQVDSRPLAPRRWPTCLRGREARRAEREDFLAFQLREIDELDPKPNEETELENERGGSGTRERLGEATRARRAALRRREALCDELGRLASQLDGVGASTHRWDRSRGCSSPRAPSSPTRRARSAATPRGWRRAPRLAEVEERLFRLQKLFAARPAPICAPSASPRARARGAHVAPSAARPSSKGARA